MYTDNKISALSAAFHKNEAEPVGFVYDSPREKRVILGEDAQQELNARLKRLTRGDAVSVEYYLYRRYVTFVGAYEYIDAVRRFIVVSGRRISLDDVKNVFREDWL